jgi:hypothetical protein
MNLFAIKLINNFIVDKPLIYTRFTYKDNLFKLISNLEKINLKLISNKALVNNRFTDESIWIKIVNNL